MKIRDSGMPGEETWKTFFDAPRILRKLDFESTTGDVVDFGCGYGTFSIAAAQLTTGTVYALDIDPQMVDATTAKAAELGLTNVKAIARDFGAEGTGLAHSSVAYAMLFNILHAENPVGLLHEAFRVLQPGGVLGIIHWIEGATPRGPPPDIRPRPEQCSAWARQVGFVLARAVVQLPPYHYGLAVRKPGAGG
jgi:SAM-dependent methyltransferase